MGSSQFYLTVVLEVTALLGYLDLDAYGMLLTNKVACHPGNFCTLDPLKLNVWLFLRVAIQWDLSYPNPLRPGVVHKSEKSISQKLYINNMY